MNECQCGCKGITKGGRFLPGHDAKLKSKLVKACKQAKTPAQRAKAEKALEDLGWGRFIPAVEAEAPAPAAEQEVG